MSTLTANRSPARVAASRPLRRIPGEELVANIVCKAIDWLGDGKPGRRARGVALRALGAQIGPGGGLRGGTHFSRPRNLHLGARCWINHGCHLDLNGAITLGDDVQIGPGTTILTTSHRIGPSRNRGGPMTTAPVLIEAGCWIGAAVTVLPGVRIGPGAVVAAGAVVTRDVPADVVVAGVPARVLRHLESDECAAVAP